MVMLLVIRDGAGKKFVSASSVEEVILKAKEKFSVVEETPASAFKLCTSAIGEASGLKIEDDDILINLVEARKPELLTVILLAKDEDFAGESNLHPRVEPQHNVKCQPARSVTPQIPNTPKCPPLPMGPLLDEVKSIVQDLKKTPQPQNILLMKRRGVQTVSKYCLGFIWKNVKDYTYSTCELYATAVFSYDQGLLKPLFERDYAGLMRDDGFSTLVTSIYNALAHLKSKIRLEKGEAPRKRRPRLSINQLDKESVDDPEPKRLKYDDYGCVRYNPALRAGETPATQEEKRLALLQMYDAFKEPSDIMLSLAKETYETQRSDIVSSNILNLKSVFQKWPHLQKFKCLIEHSDHLLGKDCLNTFFTNLGENAKSVVNYLEQFWSVANKVPASVQNLLQKLREVNEPESSSAGFSVYLIPLLLHFFKEDSDVFYQLLKCDATEEEVFSASAKANLNPTIIVKGSSLFDADTYHVVILNSVIIDAADFIEASLLSLLCFYIFGLKYPKETQVTYEFMQRTLLQINPDHQVGDKRVKPRRGSRIDSKLLKLTEAISRKS